MAVDTDVRAHLAQGSVGLKDVLRTCVVRRVIGDRSRRAAVDDLIRLPVLLSVDEIGSSAGSVAGRPDHLHGRPTQSDVITAL